MTKIDNDSKKFIDSYKNKILNPEEERDRMESKFEKYMKNPEYKERAITNLIDSKQDFEHHPEVDTFGKQDPAPNIRTILESDLDEVKNKVTIKKSPSFKNNENLNDENDAENEEFGDESEKMEVKNRGLSFADGNPKRVTIIMQDKEGGSRMT